MKTWIVADPEHPGGSPRVRDTRLSVALLLETPANGSTIAETMDAGPTLTVESICGVLKELSESSGSQAR